MEAQDEWSSGLIRSIAIQVRRYRKERKLSARQLADRCAAIGFGIPRTVLADLENGRRQSLGVAELLVLARALDVSPVDLVFPVGYGEQVRCSPGERVPVIDAVDWWAGRLSITGIGPDVTIGFSGEGYPLKLFRDHATIVRTCRLLRAAAEQLHDEAEWREARSALGLEIWTLTEYRRRIRSNGLIPPELPDDLAFLESSNLDSYARHRGDP